MAIECHESMIKNETRSSLTLLLLELDNSRYVQHTNILHMEY